MTWNKIDITSDHREAIGSYNVVGVMKGVVPWVREEATIYYTEERPFDVLEQFVVRCIVELAPITNPAQIANVLGLGKQTFIAPIMNELARMKLTKEDEAGIRPSMALKEAFEKGVWVEQHMRKISNVCNPFSGERFSGQSKVSEQNTNLHLADLPKSKLGKESLASWASSDDGPLRDAKISKIELQPYRVVGKEYHSIIFEDHLSSSWGWEPYDPEKEEISVTMRSALERQGATPAAKRLLEREGYTVLAPTRNGNSGRVDFDALSKRTIGETEYIHRYSTVEAAERINEMIADATDEILISFPWIKGPALTLQLLKALEAALKKGAFLYIGYGISKSETEEDSHSDAIEKLQALSQVHKGEVRVLWTGESHVKEIVVDRSHYMGGSFNRLSFRGDASRSTGNVRRESMIHTNNPEVVESCIQEFVPILREALYQKVKDEPLRSYAEWRTAWRPLFRLGGDYNHVEAALSMLPNTGKKKVTAVEELFNQFRDGPGVSSERSVAAVLDSFALDTEPHERDDPIAENLRNAVDQFCNDRGIEKPEYS